MTVPDLDEIRAHFPAITGAEASGDLFLDAAGGSQVPQVVIDATAEYLATVNVQLGAATASSQRSGATVERAHQWLAEWMGAPPDSYGVIIGPTASSLLAMVGAAVGRAPVDGRDEIVIGLAGHESNIAPWLRLTSQSFKIRWWDADRETGASDLTELASLVGDRTRLVAVHHVSNLTGEIEDLGAIVDIAHRKGAAVVADGVAFAPHRAMEVARLGVDAYAFSLYKAFGPELAGLAASHAFLATLDPPNHSFVPRDAVPYAFELGGASRAGCAGALAVAEYFASLAGRAEREPQSRATVESAYARIAELEAPLTARILSDLSQRPTVRVLGPREPTENRLPTVSFVVDGESSSEIARRAGSEGIGVRSGHFHAYRLTEHLGLDPADGAVRISLAHTNHPDELTRWESFLDSIAPRV